MRTNIEIDDALLLDATKATGLKTKREVVEAGLRTLVRAREQRRILDLRGIGWTGDLDEMRRDKDRS